MANKKARGLRAKTRSSFKSKGRNSVNKLLESFEVGSNVVVKIQSSVHSAIPHRRYNGHCGKITGMRGRAYIVKISQMNSERDIIVSPVHLHALGGGQQ